MTPTQTVGILTALVALDPRQKSGDETTARAKETLWADLLADVDGGWCLEYIKRVHKTTRLHPLSPGEIIGAWDAHVAYERRMAPRVERPDDRPTPERIAEIRKAAGLEPFKEPQRSKK